LASATTVVEEKEVAVAVAMLAVKLRPAVADDRSPSAVVPPCLSATDT
jgi:hypothetical protein